ncbi:MAG TPA: hypothetical protein VGP76_05360 [Planctomycetaceae bacterium]|nr:hypothetical protein [Planctomycetaceae bacterium]
MNDWTHRFRDRFRAGDRDGGRVGDYVTVSEGTFESFEGTVEAIDEEHGKIRVLIEIFGRSTPVELEYWQAKKV